MDDFEKLSPEERRIFFEGTATPRNVQAQIMERDFWVCWTLKEMFRLSAIGEHLIFKGGTSLSKVFRLIERFSEDIDVSIDRGFNAVLPIMPSGVGRFLRKRSNHRVFGFCNSA